MRKALIVSASFLVLPPLTSCASSPSPQQATPTAKDEQQSSPMQGMMGRTGMMGMMGGWHYRSPYGRQYFTGTEITLKGTVEDVTSVVPRPQMMQGIQIILKTDKGRKSIHLGPEWYIREQEINLKKGDTVEVLGKLIGEGESAIVIASEIHLGQQKWVLRDREGIPNWCALRMGPAERGSKK